MQSKTKEADVLKSIKRYSKLKKLCLIRVQTSGTVRSSGKKTYMTKSTCVGFSDLLLLMNGRTYYIELKSPTGKLSKHQSTFCKMVQSSGCVYIVCRSLDQFIEFVDYCKLI